jgi:hypothetical protein
MSTLVTMKLSGDVAAFKRLLESEPERLKAIAEKAKAAGAIHHRFGVGDGYVLVVDEWDSAGAFEQFVSDPEMGELLAEAGAHGQPEILLAEVISSPDEF